MIQTRRSLRHYNDFGARRIGGWFSRIDAEIFASLLLFQRERGIQGATAEIGVHEGKSFIPLCLALAEDERAICIDVFEDQYLNLDGSGRGSFSHLRRNLARSGVSDSQVEIVKASSLGFPFTTILDKTGPLRFISIDGGHWPEIVENDLELARLCAAPGAIIALDDFFDVDWPGVTVGFLSWHAKNGGDYSPFAVSSGKLYVCHRSHHDLYKEHIVGNCPRGSHTKKNVDLLGFDIPVISGPPPGVRGKLSAYLRTYHPGLNQIARKLLSGAH